MSFFFPSKNIPFKQTRNRAFLYLQEPQGETSRVAKQIDGDLEALQRFDTIVGTSACYERARCRVRPTQSRIRR